jgi:carboxypeptidase Taq
VQKEFPEVYKNVKLEDFYLNFNRVTPSLIRVESDEVTYNLHIVIRFELEKELIDGSIEVKDLPKIWNDKYFEYLGVKVPNDAQGVLQDVHWSAGLFGYFPTYTLGNLYSAQFFNKAKQDIMNLDRLFEKGKFQPLLEWLRKNIHQHGRLYQAGELCERVTGEPLNSDYYADYISAKYGKLYKL